MKTAYRQMLCIILTLSVISNAACTSLHTFSATRDVVAEQSIKPGDKLTLTCAVSSERDVEITAVGEFSIRGIDSDGSEVVANYDELAAIKLVKIDGSKTMKNAGKVIGIVALGALLASAASDAAMGGFTY